MRRRIVGVLRGRTGALLAASGVCAVAAAFLADPIRGQSLSIGWSELWALVGGVGALVCSVPAVRQEASNLRARSLAESPSARAALARRPLSYLRYGVSFAAFISFVEIALRTYEKTLGWRVIPSDYLWKIPLGYLVLIGGIAGLFCLVGLMRPDHRVLRVQAFLSLAIGLSAILLIVAPGGLDLAVVFLAIGASVQLARIADRHAYALHVLSGTLGAALTIACALGAAVAAALPGWQERTAIAQLPPVSRPMPNVLLLVLDTVRAKSMSLYGYQRQTTPRLDRFAARGIVFERAISTSPWTLPSHGSMFTGHYPRNLSAGWTTPIDARRPTLAEALAAQGYLTAGFIGNFTYGGAEFGLGRGFTHYEDHITSVTTALTATSVGRELMDRIRDSEWSGSIGRPERKNAARINEDFLRWLAGREAGRPYFAFVNYFDAHAPYLPPAGGDTRFSARTVYRNPWARNLNGWSADDIRGFNDAYDDVLHYLDDQVGRLLDTLQERGELDNTVVIITADHGEQFGEHGLLDHAASLYLPLLHVPLIVVQSSKVPSGQRVERPVSLRNLANTILELAGGRTHATMPGASLIDWDTGKVTASTEALLSETERTTAAFPTSFPARRGRMKSIVFDGMHFIRNYGSGREELYRLTDDLDEEHDLAPANPELAGRFRARLDAALASPVN